MTNAYKDEEKNSSVSDCGACDEDQPNQLAHCGPGGCLEDLSDVLYDRASDRVTVYETAALIHEIIFYLKMDRGIAQQIPPVTADEAMGLEAWVIRGIEIHQYAEEASTSAIGVKDLIALCDYILKTQEA